MRLVILLPTVFTLLLSAGFGQATAQQIREVNRRFIGDIGYAMVDRRGTPVVIMNPAICRRVGPELCSFFRAHERAHHALGHFSRNISVQQKEAEADRYAANSVSPASRAAAQRFFASGRGGSWQHGSSQQRLARVSGQGRSYYATRYPTTPRTVGTRQATMHQFRSSRFGATNCYRSVHVPIRRSYCRF